MNTTDEKLFSSTGELDPNFGADGAYEVSPPSDYQVISPQALVLGPAGDSYYACSTIAVNGVMGYAYFHLTEGGTLDTTFGKEGYVFGDFGTSRFFPRQIFLVDIQATRKILVVGDFRASGSPSKKALFRMELNGTADATFGNNGLVIVESPATRCASTTATDRQPNNDQAQASVMSDGKILLLQNLDSPFGVITVLNSDGSPDKTFNKTGHFTAQPENALQTFLESVMRLPDGKYLAVGWVIVQPSDAPQALFIQLDGTGQLDTSFNKTGYLSVGEKNEYFAIHQLALQPNQRFLAIGEASASIRKGLLISREPNGEANIQFNRAQPLKTVLDYAETGWLAGTVQSDGKLLVAGRADLPMEATQNVVIARFISDGTLDTSFGKGTGSLRFPQTTGSSLAIAFMPDKVLFFSWTTDTNIKIMRGLLG
ncbi:hypothetical protein [Pseudomonas sp. NPDC087615]|uniref:hypothetical protein n=1 Tax=Pseudomonas sp. NPDC087615 TaxID=3364443 RepID=UPI00380001AC